jgi:hypothetical protein
MSSLYYIKVQVLQEFRDFPSKSKYSTFIQPDTKTISLFLSFADPITNQPHRNIYALMECQTFPPVTLTTTCLSAPILLDDKYLG